MLLHYLRKAIVLRNLLQIKRFKVEEKRVKHPEKKTKPPVNVKLKVNVKLTPIKIFRMS